MMMQCERKVTLLNIHVVLFIDERKSFDYNMKTNLIVT